MVSAQRIALLRERASSGYDVRISTSFVLAGKIKIKAISAPTPGVVPTSLRSPVVAMIDALAPLLARFVTMDRGHAHSAGQAWTASWLQSPATVTAYCAVHVSQPHDSSFRCKWCGVWQPGEETNGFTSHGTDTGPSRRRGRSSNASVAANSSNAAGTIRHAPSSSPALLKWFRCTHTTTDPHPNVAHRVGCLVLGAGTTHPAFLRVE